MPLELEFVGNFFSLADFFHDIKRFVRVANKNVVVSGRLITVDGVRFSSDHGALPADHRRGHRHRLPVAEGAGRDGRRDARRAPPPPAATPASQTAPPTTPPRSSPAPTATATP